ncbi:hypothetical protein ACQRC6_08200 [Peptoniphilus sp. SGI.035]|uniref:hypothetical protein n=1 Tax=Peptoniphilus sp. SGI.035 TaxID=3420564 RepID=UPI003D068FFE
MLTPNQMKYLNIIFNKYDNPCDKIIKLTAKNLDDFFNLSTSLEALNEQGLIIGISDNFKKTTYDVIKDRTFEFTITEKLSTLYQQQNQREK